MTKTAWISWVPSNSPPCIFFFCHKFGWNFFVLWSSIWVFMSHCQSLDFVFVYFYVEGLLISPPLFLVLLPELWAHKICRLWPVCVIEVMLVVLAESAQFMVALRQQSVPWIFHMWNKWVWWKMRTHSTKAVSGRTQVTLEVHMVKLAFANRSSTGYKIRPWLAKKRQN